MSIKRRNFLLFLGAGAGSVALGSLASPQKVFSMPFADGMAATGAKGLSFSPVKLPLPLEIDGMSAAKQMEAYSTYEVQDDIVLPEGFTYDVIGSWGDPIGDSRFGYNNDYLSLVETSPNEGYLTINFEYISGKTWRETYPTVVGKALDFDVLPLDEEIDAFGLSDSDPRKARIVEIAKEALIDQGFGVISVRREADGRWVRTYSNADRRTTGISGLEDGRYLQTTGPAAAVFNKTDKMGYDDGLGDRIVGSIQNCAGGTSPWGTVFSAEENFQDTVYEPVMADGSAFSPSEHPFAIGDGDIYGRGSALGLPGNKYGWMVEVDPANPNDYGTKHTWLGRYRHEAVGFFVQPGKKLAVYSGCDRRGGHLYKFVSNGTVRNVTDKANSRLLADGMLYGAKFEPNGTGTWIALTPDTPVDPILPSTVAGGKIKLPNPDRQAGGFVDVESDADAQAFKQQFRTLGDLYMGNSREEVQGAIMIDAHYAATAAGVTTTARPEDTIVAPDGTLYIAFTSGSPGGDGGPDASVFKGPNGEMPYEHGWIVSLRDSGGDPASMNFRWGSLSMGGEPADGGAGFSNPDNIEIDADGHVWMVTDMSTSKHNLEVPTREDVSQSNLRGIFGNNSTWFIPTSGPNAGEAYPFAIAPMETETCGPFLSRDQQTLFVAIQHPGETHGMRQNMASETRKFAMTTPDGQEFMQDRVVPLGSNWPGKGANDPPKPSVVAIRRISSAPIRGLY